MTAAHTVGFARAAPNPRSLSAGRWYLLAVLVAVAMVGCAQATGQRAVMFPEGVALAFGVWVVGRPDWRESRPRLVLAPLSCAACGVLITHLLPSRLLAELAALSCAVLILLALPARIGPAVSAAVLPAVFDVRNWIYPLAVVVVTLVIVAAQPLLPRDETRASQPRRAQRWPTPPVLLFWGAAALWLATVSVLHLPIVAAAPPLLVSALEWILADPAPRWRIGLQRGALLVLAWAAGSVAAWQISPLVVAAACACLLAAALMWLCQVPHAPVLAMALVADVAGPTHSWLQTARGAGSIALAVTVLYLLGAAVRHLAAHRGPATRVAHRHMSPGATGLRHVITAGTAGSTRSPS